VDVPRLIDVYRGDEFAAQRTVGNAHDLITRGSPDVDQEVERCATAPRAVWSRSFPALALEFGIAYERTVLAWIDALPWMQPSGANDAVT
jgi:hypothetical protein